MRWRDRTIGLLAALVVGGCAAAASMTTPPAAPPRLVVPLDGDPARYAALVAGRAARADVIYLGETHDDPQHHAIQARILEAILARGAQPAVAFEMLSEEMQPGVDEALAGGGTAAEIEQQLRWRSRGWPDFAMYWPLFELARRHRLPVIAADLDPVLVRRITREGLAAVGDQAARLAPRLPPDPARERALAGRLEAAHCYLLPESHIPRMIQSWDARNVTMARHLIDALGRARPVVTIIGRGHQEEGGVPAEVAALRPGTRQLVVALVEAAPGESAEAAAREASADVVWLTPAIGRGDPCAGLRGHLARPAGAGTPPGAAGERAVTAVSTRAG